MQPNIRRLVFALLLPLAGPALAEDIDCTDFMTGKWVGVGEVSNFGQIINVDNTLILDADGTFKTAYRFQHKGQDWQQQTMEGAWTAQSGEDAGTCAVSMAIEGTLENGGSYSSSSQSTYVIIDADTVTSMDFPLQRMKDDTEGSAPPASQ